MVHLYDYYTFSFDKNLIEKEAIRFQCKLSENVITDISIQLDCSVDQDCFLATVAIRIVGQGPG